MFLAITGKDRTSTKEYTRQSEIFRRQFANLGMLMTVNSYRLTLGSQLLANGLISFDCYQSSINYRGHNLLSMVYHLLQLEPFQIFRKLIDILENVNVFEYIAKKMKHDLKLPVYDHFQHSSEDEFVPTQDVHIFREQYVTLADFLSNPHNRMLAACQFYSTSLISHQIYIEALNTTNTNYVNGVILLNALHPVIAIEPDAFKRFTRVLEQLVKEDSIDQAYKLMISDMLQKMN